jgi:hypothetical protein
VSILTFSIVLSGALTSANVIDLHAEISKVILPVVACEWEFRSEKIRAFEAEADLRREFREAGELDDDQEQEFLERGATLRKNRNALDVKIAQTCERALAEESVEEILRKLNPAVRISDIKRTTFNLFLQIETTYSMLEAHESNQFLRPVAPLTLSKPSSPQND